jgi:NTP pyrophosphatase (non-canonical NTP hydrolase)
MFRGMDVAEDSPAGVAADVLFSVLLLAHELNLNLGQSFLDKLEKTAAKYPIEKAKGSPRKYTEL